MQAHKPNPRVGVGVFVLKDGKFIMGRRKGSHGSDTWSLPGGHLEFGESFQETAAREVKEETGLEICNIRFGGVTNDIFHDDNKHYVTIWMLSDHQAGIETVTEPDKFVDLNWFTLDCLPEPLFLTWRNLMDSQFIHAIRAECEESLSSSMAG